jgi:hypothetical protein
METQGSPQDARVGAIPFAIFVVAGTRIGGGAGSRHGRSACSFWGMGFFWERINGCGVRTWFGVVGIFAFDGYQGVRY